ERAVSAYAGKANDRARSGNPRSSDGLFICCACRWWMWSEIQDERSRLRARAADHHGAVRRLLVLAEEEVAVIRDPFDHPGLAGAADAFSAGVIHRDAGIEQRVQDGLARGHADGPVAACELHFETALRGRLLPRFEVSDMHLFGGPTSGRRFKRFQHRHGTAAIEMRVGRRLPGDSAEVERPASPLLVEVQTQLHWRVSSERSQLVEVWRRGTRSRRVEQLPGAPERLEAPDHREERRDSDPARDQNRMPRILPKGKIVSGMGDCDDVTGP